MNVITQPFTLWETALFTFLNAFPYMLLVIRAFRPRLRFGRGTTMALLLLVTALHMGINMLRLHTTAAQVPLLDVVLALLDVIFIPLIIRERLGKLVFTVLVVMDLGNLVVVLSKCIEGLLFPAFAPLRYHFTYSLVMLPVELIILPLIYLLIFRGICSGEAEDDGSKEAADTWRYLWLVPAVFYIIWMQHFYASGRSTLENSLDPVSTVYLLLIDAGSVLIYRIIVQLERTLGKNRRLMAENHALNLQAVQYDTLRKRMGEARQARHDLRHHIMLLRSIRDNRDFAALDELLAGYPELESLERPLTYCENEMANAILAHFGDKARERDIAYTVKLEVPENLFVEKPDLAVLFGNLLENAVDAAALEGDGRFIRVTGAVERREGVCVSLSLKVENSCTREPQLSPDGAFQSMKHAGDGVGTSSVRSIAERYGGASSFAVKDRVFTASVVLYPKG